MSARKPALRWIPRPGGGRVTVRAAEGPSGALLRATEGEEPGVDVVLPVSVIDGDVARAFEALRQRVAGLAPKVAPIVPEQPARCDCEMCRPSVPADFEQPEHPLVPRGRELARRLADVEDYEGAALVARFVEVARAVGSLQYDNRTAARTLHAILPIEMRMHGTPPVRDLADAVIKIARR